jgi:hypothetical protein
VAVRFVPPFDEEQLAWKPVIEARPRLAGVKLTLTDVVVTTTVGREGLPGTPAASAYGMAVDTRPDMLSAIASSHRPIDIGLSPRSACLALNVGLWRAPPSLSEETPRIPCSG